jgi:hypothetical protein
MAVNVRAALAHCARRKALLGIVYATDAKIEPAVKVVGAFPDNSHDPIVYPAAATVNAKAETIQYLAFLQSAAANRYLRVTAFRCWQNQRREGENIRPERPRRMSAGVFISAHTNKKGRSRGGLFVC